MHFKEVYNFNNSIPTFTIHRHRLKNVVLSMAWFQITLCLSNLMLTGSATPFLHNGILPCLYTEESNFDFGEGKVGVKRPCRSVCRVGVPAGGHHWAE